MFIVVKKVKSSVVYTNSLNIIIDVNKQTDVTEANSLKIILFAQNTTFLRIVIGLYEIILFELRFFFKPNTIHNNCS